MQNLRGVFSSLVAKLIVFISCYACYCDCEFTDGQNGKFVDTVVIGNDSSNGTITIGYLMDQLIPPYRIGAIQLAIADGQANGLLPGYNFRFVLHFIRDCVRNVRPNKSMNKEQ